MVGPLRHSSQGLKNIRNKTPQKDPLKLKFNDKLMAFSEKKK